MVNVKHDLHGYEEQHSCSFFSGSIWVTNNYLQLASRPDLESGTSATLLGVLYKDLGLAFHYTRFPQTSSLSSSLSFFFFSVFIITTISLLCGSGFTDSLAQMVVTLYSSWLNSTHRSICRIGKEGWGGRKCKHKTVGVGMGELDSQSGQFIILSDFTECCSGTIYTEPPPPQHH